MLKLYRKLFLIIFLILFVFTSNVAFAANDINGHWAEEEINQMIEKGYLNGYPDGSFEPNNELTRAQFVKVINKVFGYKEAGNIPFDDVKSFDWFYNDVRVAYKAGYIKGVSAENFGPNIFISREDVAVILTRVLNLEEDESYCRNFSDYTQISDYARGSVGALLKSGIMTGYNKTFNPKSNIKRGEVVVVQRAKDYGENKESTENPIDTSSEKSNSKDKKHSHKTNIQVVLSDAKFNGLTNVALKTNILLDGITSENIIITKKSGEVIPSDKIRNIQSGIDELSMDIDIGEFASETSEGTTVQIKEYGRFNSSNVVSVGINGDSLGQVWDRITDENPENNSLWHNVGKNTAIKIDPIPYEVQSNAPVYKQIGTLKGLMVVIDFPDARAMDNTGINGLPGENEEDDGNRINGHVLRTADDYYDWLIPRAKEFFNTVSYGNLDFDVDLVKNPNDAAGVFTCMNSLYGGLESDEAGHTGYALDRGGDVDSYVKDGLTQAKSQISEISGEYDIIYVVAVENAVGISYGPMDTWGGNANAWSGRTDLKAMVRIGHDSYSAWKSKGINHETCHSIGAPDYYVNAFSGYGGGQTDPVTGRVEYYPNLGHWDLMGYINGPAPDLFSWMKWRLGWIRDDQVDIIDSDGTTTHQLSPLEIPGGTKCIVIPSKDKGIFYVIENRQALGADNTSVTERFTDPAGSGENWPHNYGTFNSPGILMYKIDANIPTYTLQGILTVVQLKPEQNEYELGASLDKSVLGKTSGIYEYTDEAAGITVKLVNETDTVNTVTVTKKTPEQKLRPILSEARFIDSCTLEFKSNVDLRGIISDKIIVKNGSSFVEGVTINQILPRRVRITFNKGQFNTGDVATVMTKKFLFYGDSLEANSDILSEHENPVLSEGKFNSLTEIEVKSNVNLSDIKAENILISKEGQYVSPGNIINTDFDEDTNILKITLKDTVFTKNAATENVILSTKPFSNYFPSELDKEMAQFNPPVIIIGESSVVDLIPMEKAHMVGIELESPAYKTYYAVGDELKLDGLKLAVRFSDNSTEILDISKASITGFDSSTVVDEQQLTIEYNGMKISYNINITEKPDDIYIASESDHKTEYYIGDELDISGLIVKGTFRGQEEKVNISLADISGFDSSTEGSKTLTVTYGGAALQYSVNVKYMPGEKMDTYSYYKFVNKGSSGVMDTYHGDYIVNWWDYTEMPNADCESAKLQFVDAGNFYYKIKTKANNSFIKVSGEDLILGDDTDDDSVLWRIEKKGDWCIIKNKGNSNVLTAESSENDAPIVQKPYEDSDYQLWMPAIIEFVKGPEIDLIKEVNLITDKEIEIKFDNDVQNADKKEDFKVYLNGEEKTEFKYLSYFNNTITLRLEDSIDPAEDKIKIKITDETISDGQKFVDTNKEYEAVYKPYYTKEDIGSKSKIIVRASDDVSLDVVKQVSEGINKMVGRSEFLTLEAAEQGLTISVVGPNENVYMVPEYRELYDESDADTRITIPGTKEKPVIVTTSKDVMRQRGTGEYALIYDFAKLFLEIGVKDGAVNTPRGTTDSEDLYDIGGHLEEAYNNAKTKNLWKNGMADNVEEYFAKGTMIFFEVIPESSDGTWDNEIGPVSTRLELRQYDRELFDVLVEVYGEFEYISPYIDQNEMPWFVGMQPNRYGIDGQPLPDAAVSEVNLITDDMIEIKFNREVINAQDRTKYKVMQGENELPVRYVLPYAWNTVTLKLKNSVEFIDVNGEKVLVGTDINRDALQKGTLVTTTSAIVTGGAIKVEIYGDDILDHSGNIVEKKIYDVEFKPYFSKIKRSKTGVYIYANEDVKDESLELAASYIDEMLSNETYGQKIADAVTEYYGGLSIIPYGKHAYMQPHLRASYNQFYMYVEGFGGGIAQTSEANINRDKRITRYDNEFILAHEFGHTIELTGVRSGLTDLYDEIGEIYEQAVNQKGKWPNSYAGSNRNEYFATLTAIWFSTMRESTDGTFNGTWGPVSTREELYRYDIDGYNLMKKIYYSGSETNDDIIKNGKNFIGTPWESYTAPNMYDIDGSLYIDK